MKVLSILIVVVMSANLVIAQTSTAVKKATLMSDGAVVTNLKTGEVIRTAKGAVQLNDVKNIPILSFTSDGTQGSSGASKNSNNVNNSNTQNSTKTESGLNNKINQISTQPTKNNNKVSPQ